MKYHKTHFQFRPIAFGVFLILCLLTPLLSTTLPVYANDPAPIRLGLGGLTAIAISPDGNRLAVGATIGVYFHNANTFTPEGFWPTPYETEYLRWSPRGDVLAIIYDETEVDFWSVAGGKRLWHSRVCKKCTIEFSQDGATVAMTPGGETVNIFDSLTGQRVGATSPALVNYWPRLDWMQSISPDRQWIVYEDGDGTIYGHRLDKRANESGLELKGHVGRGRLHGTFAWSPDSLILYSAIGNTVRAWDIHTQQQLRILDGFSPGIYNVAWSNNGQFLLSVEGDYIVVRDIDTLLPIHSATYDKSYYSGSDLILNPTNSLFALTDVRGINLYDYATLQKIRRIQVGRWAYEVTFSSDGIYLATAGYSPIVNVWETATGALIDTVRCSQYGQSIGAIAFRPDSYNLFIYAADGKRCD